MDGLLMKYFVLKPKGTDIYARASRLAMLAYAREIAGSNLVFARELVDWVEREQGENKDGN